MNLVTVSEKIGGRVVAEAVAEMNINEIKELRTLCEYELSIVRGKIETAKSCNSDFYSKSETRDYIAKLDRHIKFLVAVDKIALAKNHAINSANRDIRLDSAKANKKTELLKKAIQQSVTDEEYLKIMVLYRGMIEAYLKDE